MGFPLFEAFPTLGDRFPRVELADLPSPVSRVSELDAEAGGAEVWVKDDGRIGELYGGNKVRKLEFLLGRALRSKVPQVITFGAAGSNHALATALYARSVGLGAISMLIRQENAAYVRKNLLGQLAAGAALYHYETKAGLFFGTFFRMNLEMVKTGRYPQIIPVGGSSPLGCAGFVNAAFELKNQVEAGALPCPDRIYVACGSMGTATGLAVGLAACGLDTRIVAVRVTPDSMVSTSKLKNLFERVAALCKQWDVDFPPVRFSEDRIQIHHGFYGEGYGVFTPEGMDAVEKLDAAAGIRLEGTYTGKTLAALLADCAEAKPASRPVLFWNTANQQDLAPLIQNLDYKKLPKNLHAYFTSPIQDG